MCIHESHLSVTGRALRSSRLHWGLSSASLQQQLSVSTHHMISFWGDPGVATPPDTGAMRTEHPVAFQRSQQGCRTAMSCAKEIG